GRIHNDEDWDVSRSIENENMTQYSVISTKSSTPKNMRQTLASKNLTPFRVTPIAAPTPENMASSITNVGVAVPGVASVSLRELLVVLKVLWPWDDTRQVITGSLQKYGSMISLVVFCLEHHDVRALDVRCRIRTYDQVADEHIPSLVRDLSFKIAHDLLLEDPSTTWQGLKYFTEARDAYHEYTQTTSTEALDRARKNCIKAANVEPGYKRRLGGLELLCDVGIAYTDKGRYAEAEKLFRQAIAIKSDYPRAFFGLGYMHGVQNHHDNALEYFDIAIKLDQENADFWFNRGAALM
ncbi:MAG: tetratricopeptide repeat protein, partial [Euryarchaeota archaeon]|nr:tetratricopeptide repeat protein [Euryarchaeota archaeon]